MFKNQLFDLQRFSPPKAFPLVLTFSISDTPIPQNTHASGLPWSLPFLHPIPFVSTHEIYL